MSSVRDCYEANVAVYPLGGETSLDYGLPARREGVGLSLAGLDRVIDYPARDMTITVEAGVTMRTLAETLARERQRLPIDVPHAERATIGGVVATNFNGPRRYGQGTVRDYVIGITAVDGTGMTFRGGGRVVKNVAGYDFCKLLTGSLGTLAVITQLTLKVKPIPEKTAFVATRIHDLQDAEPLLAALVQSATTPAAIELLAGPEWSDVLQAFGDERPLNEDLALVVGFEGTAAEVDWQVQTLGEEWREQGAGKFGALSDKAAEELWRRLTEFPAATPAPLVLQASVVPSGVTRFLATVREVAADCSIQSHAGNGIAIVRFAEFPKDGLSRTLIGRLQPAASAAKGHVVILANPGGAEMTHQSVWGGDAAFGLMGEVKKKFDPNGILNPGRFVYQGMEQSE
ncbi:MAG: FAD-binding oxidoreductase [Planctomycetes bacterium]|nr:FAD-binding oxidoreductase [Planctomycetota bacterium]